MEKKINILADEYEISKNRETLNRFISAMSAMEIMDIEPLIAEEGDYHGMGKREFLCWLQERFSENIKSNIFSMSAKLRFCNHCRRGNTTILFNQGFFPKKVKGHTGPKGFMLEFKDAKIVDIGICYKWLSEKEFYFCTINN